MSDHLADAGEHLVLLDLERLVQLLSLQRQVQRVCLSIVGYRPPLQETTLLQLEQGPA